MATEDNQSITHVDLRSLGIAMLGDNRTVATTFNMVDGKICSYRVASRGTTRLEQIAVLSLVTCCVTTAPGLKSC